MRDWNIEILRIKIEPKLAYRHFCACILDSRILTREEFPRTYLIGGKLICRLSDFQNLLKQFAFCDWYFRIIFTFIFSYNFSKVTFEAVISIDIYNRSIVRFWGDSWFHGKNNDRQSHLPISRKKNDEILKRTKKRWTMDSLYKCGAINIPWEKKAGLDAKNVVLSIYYIQRAFWNTISFQRIYCWIQRNIISKWTNWRQKLLKRYFNKEQLEMYIFQWNLVYHIESRPPVDLQTRSKLVHLCRDNFTTRANYLNRHRWSATHIGANN